MMDSDPKSFADKIRHSLADRLFGKPIVQNNFRGEVAEEIVKELIDSSWSHSGADWGGWDFERQSQGRLIRLQVKQAAARQSWDGDEPIPSKRGVFLVGKKSGYYKGSEWLACPGRHAEIFVLCWHDDATAGADHFDHTKWEFFVLPVTSLSDTKNSISVDELRKMAAEDKVAIARSDDLGAKLEHVVSLLSGQF